MIIEILLATLFSMLLLLVEHWFPWRLALRRDLHRVAAYVLGVMAMAAPLSALYLYWDRSPPDLTPFAHLIALWSVIVGSGLAVMGAYLIDGLLKRLARSVELEEILETQRESRAAGQQPNPQP